MKRYFIGPADFLHVSLIYREKSRLVIRMTNMHHTVGDKFHPLHIWVYNRAEFALRYHSNNSTFALDFFICGIFYESLYTKDYSCPKPRMILTTNMVFTTILHNTIYILKLLSKT